MTAAAETGFDLILCGMIVATALFCGADQGQVRGGCLFHRLRCLRHARLGATDVALAEAALGAGLTGILLLVANARLPASAPAPSRGRALVAVCSAGITLVLGWAFMTLPSSDGLREPVAANLDAAGAQNPVTAVLLNFRGRDTLLESVVLLAALIGVWSVSHNAAWGGRPGLKQHVRPDGVLARFGQLLPPVGLMLGVYLVWAGLSHPGGAFQGGTVLAAVALLVMMGGWMRPPPVASRWLRLVLVAGPALFLAVGFAGAITGTFLGLRPDLAKPLILGIEAVLTLSIAATLALLVVGPAEDAGEPRD